MVSLTCLQKLQFSKTYTCAFFLRTDGPGSIEETVSHFPIFGKSITERKLTYERDFLTKTYAVTMLLISENF